MGARGRQGFVLLAAGPRPPPAFPEAPSSLPLAAFTQQGATARGQLACSRLRSVQGGDRVELFSGRAGHGPYVVPSRDRQPPVGVMSWCPKFSPGLFAEPNGVCHQGSGPQGQMQGGLRSARLSPRGGARSQRNVCCGTVPHTCSDLHHCEGSWRVWARRTRWAVVTGVHP